MVFLMLFLFGLICLLAVLGSDRYYDEEDDEELAHAHKKYAI